MPRGIGVRATRDPMRRPLRRRARQYLESSSVPQHASWVIDEFHIVRRIRIQWTDEEFDAIEASLMRSGRRRLPSRMDPHSPHRHGRRAMVRYRWRNWRGGAASSGPGGNRDR